MGRVIVVGSLNVDFVVRAPVLPAPGVTVSGEDLARHHGGKGGNQAVAAARLGATVALVGAVGDDELGEAAKAALVDEGVDVRHVARLARPTGVALIVVDAAGQNQIAVAPGANGALQASFVTRALEQLEPRPGDVLLASREVPDPAVRAALSAARAGGATTVLNPAPGGGLPAATRELADWLTPNEHELAELTGRPSQPQLPDDVAEASQPPLAEQLLAPGGTRWLAVTLGAAGAALLGVDGGHQRFAAPAIEPIDTTGAGDTFNGALAALLAGGRPPTEAVRLAVVAASLSTLRAGAREAMPSHAELGVHVAG